MFLIEFYFVESKNKYNRSYRFRYSCAFSSKVLDVSVALESDGIVDASGLLLTNFSKTWG